MRRAAMIRQTPGATALNSGETLLAASPMISILDKRQQQHASMEAQAITVFDTERRL